MKHWTHTTAALAVTVASATWTLKAVEVDLSKLPPPAAKQGVTFEKDIKPLFDASCVRCHGSERPKAKLRLDTLDGALQGSKDGKVITPGNSKDSPLVLAVSQLDAEKAMPPKFKGRRGPGGPGGPPPGGPGGPPPDGAGVDSHQGGPGGPPPGGRGFGPPPKPLTPEQVGLVRAWIDQGAK